MTHAFTTNDTLVIQNVNGTIIVGKFISMTDKTVTLDQPVEVHFSQGQNGRHMQLMPMPYNMGIFANSQKEIYDVQIDYYLSNLMITPMLANAQLTQMHADVTRKIVAPVTAGIVLP